jgi:hypothetical protein
MEGAPDLDLPATHPDRADRDDAILALVEAREFRIQHYIPGF